jgi:phage terminase small subunit
MTNDAKPLSPRHERFVAEFLKDGNATQAYIRAGYARRGAQPCASRLLRDPRIGAAIAAGRQRITETLQVSVERVTQEYAKIAFASVTDFVSTDENGRLRIDLEKANQAQRAGIVELWVSTHSKQEQRVRLKLGKLQALAALAKQLGMQGTKRAAKPVDPHDFLAEDLAAARRRAWGDDRPKALEREPAEIRTAAAAQVKSTAAGLDAPSREAPPPPDDRPPDCHPGA